MTALPALRSVRKFPACLGCPYKPTTFHCTAPSPDTTDMAARWKHSVAGMPNADSYLIYCTFELLRYLLMDIPDKLALLLIRIILRPPS